MGRYIARRLLQTIFVLWAVSFIAFIVMFLTGDPASAMAGENWTREQVDEFRHIMGFDQPWYVQYWGFLSKALQGDLGVSLRQRQPNLQLVFDRMPATLELALTAMLISIVVALPAGIISATKRNSWFDNVAMLGAMLGQSMPAFWLGVMLILIFGVTLHWTPIAGRGSLNHLILPAITLSAYPTARNARVMRSSLLEVLGLAYVTTARAKGLKEHAVLIRHAVRNALIPLVTLIGLEFGALLGGAVITETIFAWPGVGRMTIQAIQGRDIPLVQASVIVLATFFVLINLIVDIIYTVLDPRIRLSE
jgi:ABC-type dipeptide/oligopeptide/nickel transport system permease component